jgi:hypothetical protein
VAAPARIAVARIQIGERVRFRLVFDTSFANRGSGPLAIAATRAPGARRMVARQRLALQGGGHEIGGTVGTLRFARASHHRHWHLTGFARYELLRSADGVRVRRDRKVGFCLGNSYRLLPDGTTTSPAKAPEGACGAEKPRLRRLRAALSAGWGDIYPRSVEGQYVDITGLPAGRYLLVNTLNPGWRMRESSHRGDVAWAQVALGTAGPGRRRPTVRVIASCGGTPVGCPLLLSGAQRR